jgi:hypothetical protein
MLPATGRIYHTIKLEEGKNSSYRFFYFLLRTQLDILREYIEDAIAKGWIQRSINPTGALILFILKKDRSLRLYVDYRGLNAATIKNRHPLPLIGETLDRLIDAKVFIKLNLKNIYYRIRIKKSDE